MIAPESSRLSPLALIADDDELMRSMMVAALSDKGFDTMEVGNGREAVAALNRLKPDLIILDVDMPVMDGFVACEQIRSMPMGESVPIVIVTGNEDTDSIEHAFQIGATDFISKPVNWALLGHRMRYVLRGADVRSALAESEAENRALLEALPDRLILLSEQGQILKLIENSRSATVDQSALIGRELYAALPERVCKLAETAVHRALSSSLDQTFEYSNTEPDGVMHAFEARVLPQSNRQALMIVRDVSEKKATEAQIHRLAFYDTLTGLPNRHHFLDRSAQILETEVNGDERFGLLFLDFDRFKRINDTLGHTAGDDALKQIAERFQRIRSNLSDQRLRSEIARLGGDEFAIFFSIGPSLDPIEFAQQLNTLLTTPLNCDRHQVVLTPSIGIATYPEDGLTMDLLLQHATRAMTAAKATGGNTHHVYSEQELESANDLLTLEIDLRQAISNHELRLYFQPKYELATRRIVGAEALLRWFHPSRGMVSPVLFIPAAEQSGLIVDIDRWVADQVCQYLHDWQLAGIPCVPLSINLSGREFCFDQPAVTMQQALSRNAIDPHLLEIEITETVLMEDIDAAAETLRELKAMGIRLAVDDFGTGYSSMSYLKRFPLDVMKIDRSFVADLESDESDRAICKAMIALAKGLNMDVVAEGIETDSQLEFLLAAGCEIGQGFLLDKPMKAGEFIERLKSLAPGARDVDSASG